MSNHLHTPDTVGLASTDTGVFLAICAVCSKNIASTNGINNWELTSDLQPAEVLKSFHSGALAAANDRQVGGTHYQKNVVCCPHCGGQLQHWDVYKFFPYLVGTIAKYLWRWRDKNGLQDIDKASHYLQKLLEVAKQEQK